MKEFAHRINYFSATFISLLGFALTPEIFLEDDHPDKTDDVLLLILGLIAIWWYKKRGHKTESTNISLLLIGLSLVTKIGAIILEHADAEALGDDIGVTISLLLAFFFVLWQALMHKKEKK